MEPVFAALTAWMVGQAIGWPVVAGGAMVLGAMLVVEAMPARPRPDAVPRQVEAMHESSHDTKVNQFVRTS
jgi:hypothetical protein